MDSYFKTFHGSAFESIFKGFYTLLAAALQTNDRLFEWHRSQCRINYILSVLIGGRGADSKLIFLKALVSTLKVFLVVLLIFRYPKIVKMYGKTVNFEDYMSYKFVKYCTKSLQKVIPWWNLNWLCYFCSVPVLLLCFRLRLKLHLCSHIPNYRSMKSIEKARILAFVSEGWKWM